MTPSACACGWPAADDAAAARCARACPAQNSSPTPEREPTEEEIRRETARILEFDLISDVEDAKRQARDRLTPRLIAGGAS